MNEKNERRKGQTDTTETSVSKREEKRRVRMDAAYMTTTRDDEWAEQDSSAINLRRADAS